MLGLPFPGLSMSNAVPLTAILHDPIFVRARRLLSPRWSSLQQPCLPHLPPPPLQSSVHATGLSPPTFTVSRIILITSRNSCHRRKVKCIGEGTKPCKNCISAGLTCTYNAIPQKKGPKGSRAKVLSELRENQRQSQLSPGTQFDLSHGSRSLSPVAGLARTPGLLTLGIVDSCVEYFFANIYPTQPILHRGRVQQTIQAMDHSVEAYCKLVSLCAYVLVQPTMVLQSSARPAGDFAQNSNQGLAHVLLEEAVRVRKAYEYSENPTILTVYTSFFIFSTYFCMDRQNAAWVYLREATTVAHIMGMHEEDTYKNDDFVDASRKRRLFWVLFMTER